MKKWFLTAGILFAAILIALVLAGPTLQRSFFYPKPRRLSSVINQPTEQLLIRLQSVLETNAPIVARALQPGLSDAEITALEAQGRFRLSADLRTFYRWHNGIGPKSTIGLLAGQRFVPLDEIVRERAIVAQQLTSASALERAALSVFAGHRSSWVHILDDGAGDGYFFDPDRKETEGSFFHHFAETRSYLWFPSVRNFLAGATECYESQAVKVAADGKSLDEDFVRTQTIWERFGERSESGDR